MAIYNHAKSVDTSFFVEYQYAFSLIESISKQDINFYFKQYFYPMLTDTIHTLFFTDKSKEDEATLEYFVLTLTKKSLSYVIYEGEKKTSYLYDFVLGKFSKNGEFVEEKYLVAFIKKISDLSDLIRQGKLFIYQEFN